MPTTLGDVNYIPDLTNNPLHGYEFYKFPNQFQIPGGTGVVGGRISATRRPARLARRDADRPECTLDHQLRRIDHFRHGWYTDHRPELGYAAQNIQSGNVPAMFPTYDNTVNSSQRLDGVNEADEMNLYTPQPAARLALRPQRPGVALPLAGRRRRRP